MTSPANSGPSKRFRIEPLATPEATPYEHDTLARKNHVEMVSKVVEAVPGPFVLALDAPFGTGKTTFVNMTMAQLRQNGYESVYLDAWSADFVSDPLIPLLAAIDKASSSGMKTAFAKVRSVGTKLIKQAAIVGAKVVTLNAFNPGEDLKDIFTDGSGSVTEDLVGSFQREQDLLASFKEELKAFVRKLGEDGKQAKLVFFIDELDRCKPDFAVRLLERVKHVFEVEDVVFVLAIDKMQIESTVRAVYGAGINASEYLRKFFDLEYRIPLAGGEKYTAGLVHKFGLDSTFAASQGARNVFVETFTQLCDALQVGLRTRERCITSLSVVLHVRPDLVNRAHLLAVLLVLRAVSEGLFFDLANGTKGHREFREWLENAGRFKVEEEGWFIEFLVMVSDDDSDRLKQTRKEIGEALAVADQGTMAHGRLKYFSDRLSNVHWRPSLRETARHIDIAAGFV